MHGTALSGPALRLQLLQLYVPLLGGEALAHAREAEAWVLGSAAAAPATTLDTGEHDDGFAPTEAKDDAGRGEQDAGGGRTEEGDDLFVDQLQRDGAGEPGAAPAAAEAGAAGVPLPPPAVELREASAAAPPAPAACTTVLDRGEATVTELLANRREELLRWWLAGKRVNGVMTAHFTASASTIQRALRLAGISAQFQRGPAGKLLYQAVPLDAPLPAEALDLLRASPAAEPEPVPPAAVSADIEPSEPAALAAANAVEPGGKVWAGRPFAGPPRSGDRGRRKGEDKVEARRELAEAMAAEAAPEIKRATSAGDHPGDRATVDDVVAFVRWCGDVVVSIGEGRWLINGRETVDQAQLVDLANRRRRRLGKPAFEVV